MSKTAKSIPTALFIAAGTSTPSKRGEGCRKLSRHAIRMLHRGHFARGARKGRRKMSDEIVQIEIDRREPGMVADPPKAEFTDDIPFWC